MVCAPFLLALPAAAGQDARVPAGAQLSASLAAELEALARGTAVEVVGQRVSTLGPDVAPLVFAALGKTELVAGERTLVVGERERAALLAGAARLGRAPFAGSWSAAASGTDPQHKCATIELIGLLGRSADLETALRALAPAAGEDIDPAAARLLEEACGRLLARERDALVALRAAILHAEPAVACHLIRALGRVPDERTLRLCEDLLGFDERLDLPLLSEIARIARALPLPFDERLRAHVRAYLDAEDRQLARIAAMAVAELQDEEAIPVLVERCAARDPALAGAAFLALERTTALTLPRRPERWRSWFQSEQRWLASEGKELPATLAGDDVPRILAALRALATHRVARQQFSRLAAPLVEHDDPRVRLEACRTLGALGVAPARSILERALADPDPAVVAAARSALLTFERGT